MLELPDVTLVCVETREHELAKMAVEDCLRAAEFGDVLILTDKPKRFGALRARARFHEVPDWPEKIGWSRSWWYDVPPLLRTRQTLNVQWDSWIWDASRWRDDFLRYDYIGAPWWRGDGRDVGNGGFSLVSTRLKRFMLKNRDRFPCDSDLDDDLLCRKYRRDLENYGFAWAPEAVAYEFAWEGCGRSERTRRTHFGFHAMFNWDLVLTDRDRLIERVRLAMASPNLGSGYQVDTFCKMNPEIARAARDDLEPLKIREN